jgi:hypothetical protein
MALTQDTRLWYARNGVWSRRNRIDQLPGSVIPGYYLGGNADITTDKNTYSMNLKGHTLYTSWAQGANAFPISNWVDTYSRNGYVMNYSWEPKVYGVSPSARYPLPNATMTYWGSQQFYSWTQITSGALDLMLSDIATKVKALPYPINIQVCSERDTDQQSGGTINGVSYTWAQLDALSVSAISYIINFFKVTMGVTNATFSAGIAGFDKAAFLRCYCPDVDYIQYNAYNHNGWQTAPAVFSRSYNWLSELPSSSANKPVWLAEWGCDTDARRPAWLATVPAAIAALPRIKYMSYFNSGWGTIPVNDATSYQALAACYDDPIFGGHN